MSHLVRGAILCLGLAGAVGAACSGGGGARPRPPAPTGAPDAGAPAATGPTERECEELISHAIALRSAELAQSLPAEQVPTDADRAALAADLRATFLPECRAGTRRSYECALAARSLADLAACQ